MIGPAAAALVLGVLLLAVPWPVRGQSTGSPATSRAGGRIFKDCPQCPEMVVIPAGSFRMGDLSGNDSGDSGDSDEKPVHRVTIPRPFAVGRFEVTRREYGIFADATGRAADGGCLLWTTGGWRDDGSGNWRDPGFGQTDLDPVVCVNWNDAKAYVGWLSRETGEAYRLLSEAEWEYVARAGSTTEYWWGDKASRRHANYGKDECCGGFSSGRDRWTHTAPVGAFDANPFEVHDLHGNAMEWVEDCYHGSYHGAPDDGRAWTGRDDCPRVVRGGSWYNTPPILRSALRAGNSAVNRNSVDGFRVARTLP